MDQISAKGYFGNEVKDFGSKYQIEKGVTKAESRWKYSKNQPEEKDGFRKSPIQ